jgi:hypothetical protein
MFNIGLGRNLVVLLSNIYHKLFAVIHLVLAVCMWYSVEPRFHASRYDTTCTVLVLPDGLFFSSDDENVSNSAGDDDQSNEASSTVRRSSSSTVSFKGPNGHHPVDRLPPDILLHRTERRIAKHIQTNEVLCWILCWTI